MRSLYWNTVYIEKAVEQLRKEGVAISDEDLNGIWPTRHSNLNVYGKYFFDLVRIGQKQALRPLRQSTIQP
ncbi:Tn3 family transposase [Leptothoe sp. PORK10 BA2]|jgi:hypothetical protein|uniref:Tn3 family transposase n=1 Tax=Leptothoe sp. PORK10 BA2 TaxID=3110254 RepID=UPI003FA36E8A